ncbi:MAG TPA: Asp23/Gls24 family envelope stress response protein [Pseudonocardiaceae bacterium]
MAVNGIHSQPDTAALACGQDAATVWDRAATGRLGTHDRDCPHCRAVADDQRVLAMAIDALNDQAMEPPPSLVDHVMGAVLTELRPADYLPLPTRHGRARIDRIAAAVVLRHAVDQMTALRVRSCRLHLIEPLASPDTHTPTAVWVHISVTARFGTDLFSATARVRQMILTAAEDLLGLPITAVDVDVVDLFADPARGTH